jgi:hypothetical protein
MPRYRSAGMLLPFDYLPPTIKQTGQCRRTFITTHPEDQLSEVRTIVTVNSRDEPKFRKYSKQLVSTSVTWLFPGHS